jgi:hypothetical protein
MSIVITPGGGDNWVSLSGRTRGKRGKVFEKHFLTKGFLRHPTTKKKIKIDDAFIASMVDNFNKGICDIVQVPLADADNRHTEDPRASIGEVIGLTVRGDKVYAVIDVRDDSAADKLGETMLGASAFIHLDYEDTASGKKVGPTLLHLCVTNRPYITGLEDYKQVIAASADSQDEAILLTEAGEKEMPTKDELIAELREKHGIDVNTLQASAGSVTAVDTTKLASDLVDAIAPALADSVSLSGSTISLTDAVDAVRKLAERHGQLSADHVALSGQVETMSMKLAKTEVATKVSEGFILPSQAEAMTKLLLTQPDVYTALLPSNPVLDVTGKPVGAGETAKPAQAAADRDAEITRLSALL